MTRGCWELLYCEKLLDYQLPGSGCLKQEPYPAPQQKRPDTIGAREPSGLAGEGLAWMFVYLQC